MSPEFWAIIGVGALITMAIVIAAQENEKRLDRIREHLEGIGRAIASKRDAE